MLVIAGGIILAVALVFVALVVLAFLPEIVRVTGALLLGGFVLLKLFGG